MMHKGKVGLQILLVICSLVLFCSSLAVFLHTLIAEAPKHVVVPLRIESPGHVVEDEVSVNNHPGEAVG